VIFNTAFYSLLIGTTSLERLHIKTPKIAPWNRKCLQKWKLKNCDCFSLQL